MKIVVVGINYAPESTGIAPYTSGLCADLVARGHSVRVLTGYPHYPEWRLRVGYKGWRYRERMDGVEVIRLRHTIARNGSTMSRLLMELIFGLRVMFEPLGGPDLVICVSPSLLSAGSVGLRRWICGGSYSYGVWVQDLYGSAVSELGKRRSLAMLVSTIERLTLRGADGVLVIHQRFSDRIRSVYGLNKEDISVVRNWTHVQRVGSKGWASQVREQRGWGKDTLVVLHAGNMGAKQGLENVVEAGKLADRADANVKFVLMGDGNRRRIIEDLARDVKSVEIIASAPQEAFATTLAAADFLLLNESAGVVEMAVPSKLTSYFSAGRPVIAATDLRSPGAQEVMASGAGLHVPAGEPQALLDAVLSLANSAVRKQAFAAAGPVYADRYLSLESSVSAIEKWCVSIRRDRALG